MADRRFFMGLPPPYRPDPEKPANPYILGHKFEVQAHNAPLPRGSPYTNEWPVPPENMHESTQLEFCVNALLDPSRAGRAGSSGTERKTLEITKTLRLTETESELDQISAQIVVVNQGMIAKIYDPLYYVPEDDPVGFDAVELADRDYCREVLAYKELEIFHGTYVPQYYGSWTYHVPTKSHRGIVHRPVRLILMEYITGMSLYEMEDTILTDEERSNIMVKVIEAESMVEYRGGVSQNDIAPRNFICAGDNRTDPELRVVLIDFNISIVRRLVLPPTPIWRWTVNPEDFEGKWMSYEKSDRGKWLREKFARSELFQHHGPDN